MSTNWPTDGPIYKQCEIKKLFQELENKSLHKKHKNLSLFIVLFYLKTLLMLGTVQLYRDKGCNSETSDAAQIVKKL